MAGAGSIVFHAGVLALALLVATLASRPHAAPMAAPVDAVDAWSGVTSAIGGERLVDVDVEAFGGQSAPVGPVAPPTPEAPPAAAPRPQPVAHAAPLAEKAAGPDETAGAEARPIPRAKAPKHVAPDPGASAGVVDPEAAPEHAAPPASPAAPRAPKRKAGVGGEVAGERGDGLRAGPFGAEGPPTVRSLGRAFTRAIPAACQADPGWRKLPVGDAGSIDVAITVDETGHITGYKPLGVDPPKQLVALVKRTVALLDAGTFALKGSVGAGVEVLRIHASSSDLDAAEAGSAATLSFGEGKAAFTQESGRHVEVTLRALKVDVAAAP